MTQIYQYSVWFSQSTLFLKYNRHLHVGKNTNNFNHMHSGNIGILYLHLVLYSLYIGETAQINGSSEYLFFFFFFGWDKLKSQKIC